MNIAPARIFIFYQQSPTSDFHGVSNHFFHCKIFALQNQLSALQLFSFSLKVMKETKRKVKVSWAEDVKENGVMNSEDSEEDDDIFGDAARKREEQEETARRARIMVRSATQAQSRDDSKTNNGVVPQKRRLDGRDKGDVLKVSGGKRGRVEGNVKRKEVVRFDMFAEGDVEHLGVVGSAGAKASAIAVDAAVDDEGYAKLMPGEKLGDDRYVVFAFSNLCKLVRLGCYLDDNILYLDRDKCGQLRA